VRSKYLSVALYSRAAKETVATTTCIHDSRCVLQCVLQCIVLSLHTLLTCGSNTYLYVEACVVVHRTWRFQYLSVTVALYSRAAREMDTTPICILDSRCALQCALQCVLQCV